MTYWKEATKDIKKTFPEYGELAVTIRKFNANHEAEITKAMANIQVIGGIQRGEMDVGKGKKTTVMLGIVKAPFPHKTLEDIGQIQKDVYNWLHDEINNFNEEGSGKKS